MDVAWNFSCISGIPTKAQRWKQKILSIPSCSAQSCRWVKLIRVRPFPTKLTHKVTGYSLSLGGQEEVLSTPPSHVMGRSKVWSAHEKWRTASGSPVSYRTYPQVHPGAASGRELSGGHPRKSLLRAKEQGTMSFLVPPPRWGRQAGCLTSVPWGWYPLRSRLFRR